MKKIIYILLISISTLFSNPTEQEMDNSFKLLGLISESKTTQAIALIKKGIDFDYQHPNYGYRRPLRAAVSHGNFEIVKALFEAGDKIQTNINTPTALVDAIWDENYKMAELLMSHGANPVQLFYNDQSAISIAVRDSLHLYIYMMINYMTNEQKMELFKYAINTENDRIYRHLSSDDVLTINYTDANNKIISKTEYASNFPIDYQDKDGKTMLMYAINAENIKLIKMIISREASLDIKDKKGVSARDMGNMTSNRELFYFISNLGNGDELEFINAAENGNLEKVKQLLKKDVRIESFDKYGSSALIHASANNHASIVALLLKKGAICNKDTPYNMTPLEITQNNGAIDAAKVLLDNKCYLDENQNPDWRTPTDYIKRTYPKYQKFMKDYRKTMGI